MSDDPTVTDAQVLEALRAVQDPDLHKDIVSLGFVKNLRSCAGSVAFEIELTTPACPVKDLMKSQAEAAVRALPGVTSVEIEMTAQVTASRPVLGDKGTIPGVKNVIAVSSGKGGVGKSTVAVNLACALARTGARVGILDADVYGPNVPLMLGVKGVEPQVVQETVDGQSVKRILPFEAHGMQMISMGLLVAEDVVDRGRARDGGQGPEPLGEPRQVGALVDHHRGEHASDGRVVEDVAGQLHRL